MTNEDKLIQENIKLYSLYQNLEKMTYFPSIKIEQILDANQVPTEAESSLYYILKLTTAILKSYMKDKSIPIYEDNSFENNAEQPYNELLAHSDFCYGLADIIKLYQLIDNDQMGMIDLDMINPPTEHPLSEYRSHTAYNHSVYFDAYFSLSQKQDSVSEKEFFKQHPLLNPNKYFTFL